MVNLAELAVSYSGFSYCRSNFSRVVRVERQALLGWSRLCCDEDSLGQTELGCGFRAHKALDERNVGTISGIMSTSYPEIFQQEICHLAFFEVPEHHFRKA